MITETNTKEIYDITGLTPLAGGYEFTFPYTSAKDIRVYTTGNRTDTEVSTSNYTIDKSGATPKVVFNSGYIFPEGQTKLTIIRSVSYSQELDLRNGDLIDADKLEGALDDITQQIQQVAEKVDRAILSSVSDTAPLSIPEASQRNNMLLGFDNEGKVIPVLTTDIEQKLAQALAAEESAITAKNAAEKAQQKAESAQSAAETAQGKAETAQAAAESAEASSQTLLASIKTKTEESIASINTAKTEAVGAVTTQQATSVAAVQAAQNTAESDIAGNRSSALTAIDTAKTAAVAAVNEQKETSVADADREIVAKRDSALIDIQTARSIVLNALTSQKDTSLQEIEQLASERKSEINSLAANQKEDVKQYTDGVVASAKTEIDNEKTTAVTAVQEEGDAEVARVQSVYQTDLSALQTLVEFYNIPRVTPKDITPYWTDGTLWDRIAGSNGYKPYDDIHVGDYIDMGRTVTCPDSYNGRIGSQYVTVASCGGFYGNGDTGITYPHLIMVPGKGFGGTQHFGIHTMHSSTPHTGYVSSDMNKSVLGPVVTEGSIATGATINQQLYYIFGSHLKTIKSMLVTAMSSSLYNRFGSAGGASSLWAWQSVQSRLMGEIEVYGSTVWSSSGYDTGDANHQFELFRFSKAAVNNRSAFYWLKDAASSSEFCRCDDFGISACSNASNGSFCVRPCFVLA